MNNWSNLSAGFVLAGVQRFLLGIDDHAPRILALLAQDEDFTVRLVKFAREFAFHPSHDYQVARQVMGEHMFGIEEWFNGLGVALSSNDLAILNHVPFDQETLEECKDTHLLVAIPSCSLVELWERIGRYHGDSRYIRNILPDRLSVWKREGKTHLGITEPCQAHWILIQKVAEARSSGMSWSAQKELPRRSEQIPSSHEILCTGLLYRSRFDRETVLYVSRQAEHFTTLRCSDEEGGVVRVVGYDDKHGCYFLSLDNFDPGKGYDHIGIVTMRVPRTSP